MTYAPSPALAPPDRWLPHPAAAPPWAPAARTAGWGELLAAALIAFIFSNALIGPIFAPDQGESPALRLMWPPVYAVTLALAAVRWRALLRFSFPAALLLALAGYALVSMLWSVDPAVTQRRAVAVIATTLFGVYLGAAVAPARLVRMLTLLILLLAVGSGLLGVINPAMGVHQDVNAGAWRGLWYEKNQLGAVMCFGVVAAVAAARLSPRSRWLWLLAIVPMLALLLLSRSKTALVCTLIGVFGMPALAMLRRGPLAALAAVWAGAAAVLVVGGAVLLAPDVVLTLLGKDPSLTGRTDIWSVLLRLAEERPVLGYGFGAFWDKDSIPAQIVRAATDWVVPNAHNSWLDLLMQLGGVGVTLGVLLGVLGLLGGLFRVGRLGDGDWSLVMLVILLVMSMSETLVLTHNSLLWALMSACLTRLLGPQWRSVDTGDGPSTSGR